MSIKLDLNDAEQLREYLLLVMIERDEKQRELDGQRLLIDDLMRRASNEKRNG